MSKQPIVRIVNIRAAYANLPPLYFTDVFAAKKQYCANLCLKINVKLGGMNCYLGNAQLPFVAEKPTIIFGADITHPAPGDNAKPSIAAIVASMDAQCSRYAAAIRVQKGRSEGIRDLTGAAVELLRTFYQFCGSKPQRVLFYRDGVSEGQFGEIARTEVEALVKACSMLEGMWGSSLGGLGGVAVDVECLPLLVFIVQKGTGLRLPL